jgi:hypothetical protein
MYLSAVTLQLSKYMVGAITVAAGITMDGVEAITMDGAIIIVGETSLEDHSERSRLRAAFSLSPTVTAMSVPGTKRTWRDVRVESAIGGKADSMCSERVFRLLTHLGHRA